jgi:uncharacterized protein YceK
MRQQANGLKVIALVCVVSLTACSTFDRVSNSDYGVYSGTRASSEKSTGMFDTLGSAIGDTVLLPFTGAAWLFGYRYQDPSTKQSPSVTPK